MDGGLNITESPVCPPPPYNSSTLEVSMCRTAGQLLLGVTGLGTVRQYQDILQGLRYSNQAEEPNKDQLNRTVSVSTVSVGTALIAVQCMHIASVQKSMYSCQELLMYLIT